MNKTTTQKLAPYLTLLAVSITSLLIVFSPILLTGRSLVWWIDGAHQHAAFLKHMKDLGFIKMMGGFDYSVGLGADFISSFTYYALFDPFSYLTYILPFKNFYITYSIISMLKFITSSFTMFIFLRYKKVETKTAITCAIVYMLSGFAVCSIARHPIFACGPIYLPLIMMGVDKIMNRKHPYLLTISVCLCAISSFYLFFMVSLFVVIYTFIICCFEKNLWRRAFCAAMWYGLGVLLAAFCLIPSLTAVLNSARGASKGMRLFGINYYIQLVSGFYSTNFGLYYTTLGMNIVLMFLLSIFIAQKSTTTEHRTLKLLILFFFFSLFFPITGYIFNMFNYSSNRWIFLFSFVAIWAIAKVLQSKQNNALESQTISKATFLIMHLLALSATIVAIYLFDNGIKSHNTLLICTSILLLLATCAALVAIYKKKNVITLSIFQKMKTKHIHYIMLSVSIFMSLIYYAFTAKEYIKFNESSFLTSATESAISQDCTTYYRTDYLNNQDTTNPARNGKNYNRPTINNYNGTFSYNTISNGTVYNFIKDNNIYNSLSTLGISGLGNRNALQSLLSVKYYISPSFAPAGFSKTQINNHDIFINDNYIPFGFVYQNTFSYDDFKTLPKAERQFLMLEAAVTDTTTSSCTYTPKLEHAAYTISTNNAEINFTNKTISAKAGSSITLTVQGATGKEIYLNINNFFPIPSSYDRSAYFNFVSSNLTYINAQQAKKGDDQYESFYDHTASMGVATDDEFDISITFPKAVKYSFDEIIINTYDPAQMTSAAQTLATTTLQNTNFTNHGFSGNITLTEPGLLFISFPYSKNWSAYVDGKKTEISLVNSAFMGINLSQGEHTVEFKYTNKSFKYGIIISTGAAIGIISFAIYDFLTRKKSTPQLTEPSA